MPDDPPATAVRARLQSITDLRELIGWDLDFRQLNTGVLEIPVQVKLGENVALLKVGFNRKFHQRGLAPANMLTFGTPLRGTLDWYGRSVDFPSMMSFNHSSGFDCVSQTGFSACVFSIKADYLVRVCEALNMPAPPSLLEARITPVLTDPAPVAALRGQLVRLLADGQPFLDHDQESALTTELISFSQRMDGFNDTTLPARSRALSRALDYIEDHGGDAVTISQICTNTGVSLRTLNRAFLERFGIGPKTYLMRRRLIGVRGMLSNGTRGMRVADAANAWGFWHMGQFARDYRNLFGELPSDTKSARRRQLAPVWLD